MIEIGPNLLQAFLALAWVAGVSSVLYFLFRLARMRELGE